MIRKMKLIALANSNFPVSMLVKKQLKESEYGFLLKYPVSRKNPDIVCTQTDLQGHKEKYYLYEIKDLRKMLKCIKPSVHGSVLDVLSNELQLPVIGRFNDIIHKPLKDLDDATLKEYFSEQYLTFYVMEVEEVK